MTGEELVSTTVHGAVGVIRLNGGISAPLLRRLREAVESMAADDRLRSFVVWGGEDEFCAGSDLRLMPPMSAADAALRSRNGQEGVACIADLGRPVIAAIAGKAVGGGLELALHADVRIATESARLGFPEVTHGRMPGAGGTQLLPRVIAPSHAIDLICSGRLVSAQDAHAMGLVDFVVPDGALLDAALERARRFADLPPLAVAHARRAVRAALEVPLPEGLALESELYGELYASDASLAQLMAAAARHESKESAR